MRMLMGANGIYADCKSQPMSANGAFLLSLRSTTASNISGLLFLLLELGNESSNKRAASPHDKGQSLEYLIRSELDRACPTIAKPDGKISIEGIVANHRFVFRPQNHRQSFTADICRIVRRQHLNNARHRINPNRPHRNECGKNYILFRLSFSIPLLRPYF